MSSHPLRPALSVALLGPLICASAFAGNSSGQAPQPREISIRYGDYKPPSHTLAVESNLVELRVTVRDRHGKPVPGLTVSDFEILDDGKPRPAEFFSEEHSGTAPSGNPASGPAASPEKSASASSAPASRHRSIALFIDDTHGGIRPLDQSKRAAEKFISSGMQPGDRVAVFTDSGDVTLDFTADSQALLAAIARIHLHTQRGAAPLSECPTLTGYQAYVIANRLDPRALDFAVAEAVACKCQPDDKACIAQQPQFVQDLATSVWDQSRGSSLAALDVLHIAVQHLAAAPEDRILVILSSGFATGDMQKQTSAILDVAVRARIVINSIDSEGLITAAEVPERNRVDLSVRQMVLPELMSDAAAATGGQFVANNNDVVGRMRALVAVPEVSYLLGFTPPARPDDKFHVLKVRLNAGKDYDVQSRAGYFYAEKQDEQGSAQQRLDREASSAQQLSQIPVTVRISAGPPQSGRPTIVVHIGVDANRLKFDRRDGRELQQLTFLTVLEDCSGRFLAGREAVMDMYLKPATLASLKRKGIHATFTFPRPDSSYQVRQVVRELVQDRLSSSNIPSVCR